MSSQTTVVSTVPKVVSKSKRTVKYVKGSKNKRSSKISSRRVAKDAMFLPRGFGQTILSERLTTTLTTSMQYYIPASAMDQVNGNYMDIRVNSINNPFNTTYAPNSLSPTYSMNGTYVQGFTINTQPMGYTLMSSTYSKYKVLGYKLRVSVMTGTNNDILEAVLCPIGDSEIPSTSTGYVNCSVLKGQPKATYKLVHNGGPNAVINQKGSVHELLGMRKAQWMDIPSDATTGAPNYPGYVGLFLQPLNGSTNNQPVVVDITLYQIVEFTDIRNSQMIN